LTFLLTLFVYLLWLISVTDDKYGALLRHVYKFCWRVASGSGKSADLILRVHREPPLLKHLSDATGGFKN
jgi:hypothetical protein